MSDMWSLIADNNSVVGKLMTSAVIVIVATVLGVVAGRLLSRHSDDRYRKYHTRKIVHYVVVGIALICLGILWRPFAGQLGLLRGLIAAGMVVALQDVISSVAGWFNVISGRVFKAGDRVEFGGVRGDVIDIQPMRTKLMEIGSSVGDDTWVKGRQYTGRVVSISNSATFEGPVFNYSAAFGFLWEEVTIPIAYQDDWRMAEQILNEEVTRISTSEEAERAIAEMVKRYPVARTEVESRVFIRATDNYLELAARFVVPVRTARWATDELTRRALARLLDEAGIHVASSTQDVTAVREGATPPRAEPNRVFGVALVYGLLIGAVSGAASGTVAAPVLGTIVGVGVGVVVALPVSLIAAAVLSRSAGSPQYPRRVDATLLLLGSATAAMAIGWISLRALVGPWPPLTMLMVVVVGLLIVRPRLQRLGQVETSSPDPAAAARGR